MQDFVKARELMVEAQLRTAGVLKRPILDAMGAVPREVFVPENRRTLAYAGLAHQLDNSGRFLPSPSDFGKLIQLADVQPDDVVLDVACGTGYSCAVLALVANAVVGLEDRDELAAQANDILARLEVGNAAVLSGPLGDGVPSEAPFDVIVIEGQVEEIPAKLLTQLKDGGRLVAVVGPGNAAIATVYVRSGDDIAERHEYSATLPILTEFRRPPAFQL